MPRMYTTPDEARTDLYLAGAVYLFGDLILRIVLGLVPLDRIRFVGPVIVALLPLVTTILVPYLLIRYRKERLADYGLTKPSPLFLRGLLIGVPLVVAALVTGWLAGAGPGGGLPIFGVVQGALLLFVRRITFVFGLVLLCVYATVKARDAFRSDPRYLPTGVLEIGRILAVVSAVTSALLILSTVLGGQSLVVRSTLLLFPLAVAGSAYLAYRELAGRQLTSRAILLTPTVILALGAFAFRLDAFEFTYGLWRAAYLAGIGLIVGALVESQRSAWGALGLATLVALLTYL